MVDTIVHGIRILGTVSALLFGAIGAAFVVFLIGSEVGDYLAGCVACYSKR